MKRNDDGFATNGLSRLLKLGNDLLVTGMYAIKSANGNNGFVKMRQQV